MEQAFRAETIRDGIISGLIYLTLFLIGMYFARKHTMKQVKESLADNEFIEFTSKFPLCFYLLIFLIGGFIGCNFVPFYKYPDLNSVERVTRSSLWFYYLFFLFTTLLHFQVSGVIAVVTNLRVFEKNSINFFKCWQKTTNISLSEIKSYKLYNALSCKVYAVNTKKDNTEYVIASLPLIGSKKLIKLMEKYNIPKRK